MDIIFPYRFQDSNCIELISSSDGNCLVKCVNPECYERYCCDMHTLSAELKAVIVSKLSVNIFLRTDFTFLIFITELQNIKLTQYSLNLFFTCR